MLNLFLDPKTQQQPVSSYVLDYALNQVGRGPVWGVVFGMGFVF